MFNIKNPHNKKLIRGAVAFAVTALVLQLLALLFMTPSGLETLFPYILYSNSEEIETGDSGIGEYFSMYDEIEDAGLVILSVDLNVADSYKLASDYLKFLGRFTRVSSVAFYTQQGRVSGISDGIVSSDYAKFQSACDLQKKSLVFPDQFYTLLSNMYTMNSRLSPDNKFTLSGIMSSDSLADIIGVMTTDFYMTPGSFGGEHMEILGAKTNEEFVSLFRKHEAAIAELMDSKIEYYRELVAYVEEDAIEENFALKNLLKFSPPGEGTVYAILPEHLCKADSVFVKKASEIYGGAVVTDTVYFDCKTIENGETSTRNDGDFPRFAEGIKIASARELSGFRNYYEKVVRSFSSDKAEDRMDFIGEAGVRSFFIIAGSDAVTVAEPKEENEHTGTVNVAPG